MKRIFCVNCNHMKSQPKVKLTNGKITVTWPKRLRCHLPGSKVMSIVELEGHCKNWEPCMVKK